MGHMALKQCRCLFASSLECASEQTVVGLSTLPVVLNVTCCLSADRCLLAHTVLTYIILSLAFSNLLASSEHIAATSILKARGISCKLSLL